MKKYLYGLIVLSVGFVISPAAVFAAEKVQMVVEINPSGNALVRGTVDSVSADSVVIKTWGGLWTAKVSASTRIMSDKNALTDFEAGDFVGVQGKISETANFTIDAKILRNRQDKRKMTMDRMEKDMKGKMEDKGIRLSLAAINNSGISGSATLKEDDGKLKVKLELVGALADAVQPAHIHVGACPGIGAVKYPLTSVANGKSETTLSVKLADLKAGLPLAINVHKSATEASTYVSCGDIKL